MSVIAKIQKVHGLTNSENQVAKFILENLETIENVGIVDLATLSYTSPSTVKRLCSKLGYESFIDFRLEIAKEIQSIKKDRIIRFNNSPVKRHDTIDDVIAKVSNSAAYSILDTNDTNDIVQYTQAIDLLNGTNHIDFYGLGPSHLVANDASIKAIRLGFSATCFPNHIEMMINAKVSRTNRIAFIVSYTGETAEIINIARELVINKVPVISITANTPNTLRSLSSVCLTVSPSESFNRLGGMSSRISALNVIDILFTSLINSDYDRYTKIITQSYLGVTGFPKI